MAICNTFNKLTNATGNFLSFDQYAKDLTRWSTESDKFRVVPSKFVALNVNYEGKDLGEERSIKEKINALLANPPEESKDYLNIALPQYIQNSFENGCAFCSIQNEPGYIYNQETVKSIFWWSLLQSGMITIDGVENDKYIKEIQYIGDINIQNYDEYNGMGYSDIFCYIPNEASCYKYKTNLFTEPSSLKNFRDESEYIEGYNKESGEKPKLDGTLINPTNYVYNHSSEFYVLDNKGNIIKKEFDPKPTDYTINTIIILYDICEYNNSQINTLYKDIPLGIYFPGTFTNTKMSNEITKYVSNSDIYGAGTSYGLRICTRFAVTPNSSLKLEIDAKADNDYVAFSQVMSAFAETHAKLNELMESTIDHLNAQKELYAIFKNSRTNVPYLKRIGGTDEYPITHWFINGRDLGPDGLTGYQPYSDQEMNDAITEWKK